MIAALDLFCGAAGGWSHGLHRAGIDTVAACEIDPWRRAVFSAAFPRSRMYDDARALTADRLRADGCWPDIIVGSPPCQEISAANCKGEGITDDHLFWEWVRLVLEVRPLWAAAENSPNARTAGIDGILDALEQAGYACWPLVVGADNAGANHRRKRLWIIAADAQRIGVGDTANPDGDGRRERGRRGQRGNISGPPNAGEHDPDASFIAARTRIDPAGREGWTRFEGNDPDADSHDGAELPPALRDIGLGWPAWNGGIAGLSAACAAAGFGPMDDGSGPRMAAALRNGVIAAFGDAVLPQITEAIGRAMMDVIGAAA